MRLGDGHIKKAPLTPTATPPCPVWPGTGNRRVENAENGQGTVWTDPAPDADGRMGASQIALVTDIPGVPEPGPLGRTRS